MNKEILDKEIIINSIRDLGFKGTPFQFHIYNILDIFYLLYVCVFKLWVIKGTEWTSQVALVVKNPPVNADDIGDRV